MKASHFQCVNCQLSFDVEADYIFHYKSEHHRYNIKRKLIGLPPLSFEQYHLQFQQQKTSKHSATQEFYCEICCKKFMNGGTYKQHLSSKKHHLNREKLKAPEKYTLSKSSSSSDFQIIGAEKPVLCLFCQSQGTTQHIRLQHCFPPFQHQCINYGGLFSYVKQKISRFQCIYCQLKFNSQESTKQHMKDTGHTKLDVDNFREYQKFYLWKIEESSSQDDQQLNMETSNNKIHQQIYQKLEHPTLEVLNQQRLQRIHLTNTGAIINGKQVGYRHLKQYYKQHLCRQIVNTREKYQPALQMGKPQWKMSTNFLMKHPKICAGSQGR